MTIPLELVLESFSPERRHHIEQRAGELIAEELTLRAMRKARKLTQTKLSKKLKIGQEGISRIEKRSDLYLSTLRSYVEGIGGELTLMVSFPDQRPVVLTGLGESSPVAASKPAQKASKKSPKSKAKSRRAA